MDKINITNLLRLVFVAAISVATTIDVQACTNFVAGKDATVDGSTMVTYAADSHTLYGYLQHLPAADHPKGAMREVREWDTGKPLGHIPEAAHTYSVIGNMNEHQLTIAESTWGGRPELVDTTGIIDYGSLMYIALQRCKTAREAIDMMTSLVNEYGYYSSGESFSIADPEEVWIMDLIGKGPDEKGAVWVAVRIPDDCIAGHANNPRIHRFPLDDRENCIYSDDVISFARAKGYFSGKDEDFDFARAYAVQDFSALRGCDARVWAFFNHWVAGMDRYLPYINGKKGAEVMPLYVKPERKLSVRDMQAMMRDHFEGTPFDMTVDAGATEWWGVPYRYRPMDFEVDGVTYSQERATATQQTGFVFVSQMRSWLPDAIGGVHWFGVDDANTAVFVPMYCCMDRAPHSYDVSTADLYTLSWESSFWVNNWVANQAYNRYSLMIGDICAVRDSLETSYERVQPDIEKSALEKYKQSPAEAVAMLTDYSCRMADDATARYKQLGEYLFVKFLDGNVKKERDGKFLRNPYGMPEGPNFPGYTPDYYRSVVRSSGDRLKVVQPEQ